ncbi:MAG: MFS transporter, partial [Candidatus Nanopelagicaceae bacterium]
MNRHLRTFYILTVTQVLSIVGSAMTNVAIGIRVFNDTGDATPLMLASFFSALPLMLGGSVAGVFADRWNRRYILLFADVGQAVGTAT